jgi:hypothetical protein
MKARPPAMLALVSLVQITEATWRADFFDDTNDLSPCRSVIIAADCEDEAVDKAAAQMDAALPG